MQHLAIIPDGNRRWAKQNKLQTILGHQKGGDAVKAAIQACLENNVKYLSIYAFSLENFNRSETEKNYLFNMIPGMCAKFLPDLIKNNVCVKFIGKKTLFPETALKGISEIEEKTQNCKNLIVNFLFCYGGRQEIIDGVKSLAEKVKAGEINIENINEETLRSVMWTSQTPDPDLIIRTSGVSRLSNLLPFQSAYSELMFLDCFWPEVTKETIKNCIEKYNQISRNFGR